MNPICKTLEIAHPIIQGGMGNISNAKLAAAVSEAGGLGTIGCGTMNPETVGKIIEETKKLTDKPFAVNIAINVSDYTNQLIQMVIDHDVPIVSLSAGNPAGYISILQEKNIKVLTVVASVKHAKKAEAAGADIIVVEGFEAAGINSSLELTTFTLIPQVSSNVNIPVIAAGGIGDGRGLAAALTLGASGVQLGTSLITTKEAPFHENYKKQLVASEGTGTVLIGRSYGRMRRILNTSYAKRLQELEKNGMTSDEYMHLTSEVQHLQGALDGDLENGFMNAGQVTGLIERVLTVRELIDGMVSGAKEQLNITSDLLN
ncbi:NAD(P)H-dependent flavin oxidoreductase [Virgibacillus siamensis]|uniref:NAD(P)H-dependent flavin oxidoreductase n=1 Tax=Virgibacillus siamensis TaxID=480071 RepID=UPI000984CB1B|nr:DUF561 domain-containing protein [Virgibacillus siamensis]